jgi:predicted DNA-binding transcriptional regulator AlpA
VPTVPPEPPPALIPANEAARLCSISPATFYRKLSAGQIGPRRVRIGTCRGSVRFRRDELVAWIAAGCPDRETFEQMKG